VAGPSSLESPHWQVQLLNRGPPPVPTPLGSHYLTRFEFFFRTFCKSLLNLPFFPEGCGALLPEKFFSFDFCLLAKYFCLFPHPRELSSCHFLFSGGLPPFGNILQFFPFPAFARLLFLLSFSLVFLILDNAYPKPRLQQKLPVAPLSRDFYPPVKLV